MNDATTEPTLRRRGQIPKESPMHPSSLHDEVAVRMATLHREADMERLAHVAQWASRHEPSRRRGVRVRLGALLIQAGEALGAGAANARGRQTA